MLLMECAATSLAPGVQPSTFNPFFAESACLADSAADAGAFFAVDDVAFSPDTAASCDTLSRRAALFAETALDHYRCAPQQPPASSGGSAPPAPPAGGNGSGHGNGKNKPSPIGRAIEALETGNFWGQYLALDTLESLVPQTAPFQREVIALALSRKLEPGRVTDPTMRMRCVSILKKLGPDARRALPALQQATSDRSQRISLAASSVLAYLDISQKI